MKKLQSALDWMREHGEDVGFVLTIAFLMFMLILFEYA